MTKTLTALQGAWFIAALEVDGNAMAPSMFAGANITVSGERFVSNSMGAVYEGALTLNPKTTPKSFELRFDKGPEAGNTALGIYSLSGETWTLCFTVTAKERPTAFATAPGSGLALEVLQRAPVAPVEAEPLPAPTGATAGPELEALAGEWAMQECVRDGDPLDASMIKAGRRIASGNESRILFGPQLFMQTDYSVDATQSPAHIEYVHTAGPSKGRRQSGIYELDGDTLRTCFSAPGQPRPTTFASTKGDGRTYAKWKLIKG